MKSRMPIRFFAETKQTGMTVPSRRAFVMSGCRVRGSYAAFLEIVLEPFRRPARWNLFNEGAMDFTDAENVGFSFVLVEAVDDDGAVVGGKVDRENARTPDFLQVQKQLFEVDVGCVELVDHDHAAQTAFLGDVHHAARQKLDALGGVDDGADGLDGVKRGHVLTDVVGYPGVSST